ncbi:MAG: hypothetical protein ACP5IB_06805 [Thermoplasmata archaeon]
MIPEKCPYFGRCNAPICPMDPSKERAVWYPDEEICKNREFKDMDLIITQKKIAKINKRHEVQGLFTFAMLNRPLRVSKGISGINEDLSIEEFERAERSWIQKHKGISESSRVKMRERMEKVRELKEGIINDH